MVVVVRGSLIQWYGFPFCVFIFNTRLFISSDEAVKEIVCALDSQEHFIIEELDENHLFIDSNKFNQVKEHVERTLEQNIFRS